MVRRCFLALSLKTTQTQSSQRLLCPTLLTTITWGWRAKHFQVTGQRLLVPCCVMGQDTEKRSCFSCVFLSPEKWVWGNVGERVMKKTWQFHKISQLGTGLVLVKSRGKFSEAGWNLEFPFEARDITIFWLFLFSYLTGKRTRKVEISYEIEILSDFALIASEHPLCKDLFQHACNPHKVTMLHVCGIV